MSFASYGWCLNVLLIDSVNLHCVRDLFVVMMFQSFKTTQKRHDIYDTLNIVLCIVLYFFLLFGSFFILEGLICKTLYTMYCCINIRLLFVYYYVQISTLKPAAWRWEQMYSLYQSCCQEDWTCQVLNGNQDNISDSLLLVYILVIV